MNKKTLKNKKIKFVGDDDFVFGILELSTQLGYEICDDGYVIEGKKISGNVLTVETFEDRAIISYPKNNMFFRGFSLAIQYLCKNKKITVNALFEDVGTMQNCSETVLTVDALKEFVRYSAIMGYTYVGIYSEATFEVESEPYFGYKGGAYTTQELKEIVDYCEQFQIEAIPYIQTLSHMNQLFRWSNYGEYIDTDNILLVDYDKTYELIDKMISSLKKAYKTNKINLGMDEGYKIGTGRYRWFINEGNVDCIDLFINHLKKVVEIAKKYDFTQPEIWFDNIIGMKFKGYIYPPEWLFKDFENKIIENFPNVKLNFWYYAISSQEEISRIIKNTRQLSKNLIFSTIIHGYSSFAPINSFAEKAGEFVKNTCLNNDINNVLVTNWGIITPFAMMAGYYRFIETFTKSNGYDFEERAKFIFGLKYSELKLLDIPNEVEFEDKKSQSVYEYNPPYYILAEDPLLGIMEKNIPNNAKEYFLECAKTLEKVENKDSNFKDVYAYEKYMCKALAHKALISKMLKENYDSKNVKGLKDVVKQLDVASNEIKNFHYAFRKYWNKYYKSFGLELFDMRIGGQVARLKVIKDTVNDYIDGKISKISELEEVRLPYAKGTEGKIACSSTWERVALGRNTRI